jgi:hypothetical protein
MYDFKYIFRIFYTFFVFAIHFPFFKYIIFPEHEIDNLLIVEGGGTKVAVSSTRCHCCGGRGAPTLNNEKDCIHTEYLA